MKRFRFILVALALLLPSACSGPAKPGSTTPALKENQKRVFLIRADGKTGELIVDENGSEKTYMPEKGCKYYENPQATIAASQPADLVKSDVILTIEKKGGKEVVSEVRGAELESKLTTRGTRVEGTYKGRDGKTGDVVVQVGGEEKKYTTDDVTRFRDEIGRTVQPPISNVFSSNSKVELAVDKKNGKDYVIEMRPAK